MYVAWTRAPLKINTAVEINTCSFKTGCQLSSAASASSLKLSLLGQSLLHGRNVLDNCQLAKVVISIHKLHYFSNPLCVKFVSLYQSIKNNKYMCVLCVSMCGYERARCESKPAVVSSRLNARSIGTGNRVLYFSLFLDGSVSLWSGIEAAGEWVQ